MTQFVPLVPYLVQVLVCLLLETIKETFFFEFSHTFLQQLSRSLVAVFTQTQLCLDFHYQLGIAQDFFGAQCLIMTSFVSYWGQWISLS